MSDRTGRRRPRAVHRLFPESSNFGLAERETGERRAGVDRLRHPHDQLKLFQPLNRDLRKLAFGAGFTRRFAPVFTIAGLALAHVVDDVLFPDHTSERLGRVGGIRLPLPVNGGQELRDQQRGMGVGAFGGHRHICQRASLIDQR